MVNAIYPNFKSILANSSTLGYSGSGWSLLFCNSGYVYSPHHVSLTSSINPHVVQSFTASAPSTPLVSFTEISGDPQTVKSKVRFMLNPITVTFTVNNATVTSIVFARTSGSQYPLFYYDEFAPFTTGPAGANKTFRITPFSNMLGEV